MSPINIFYDTEFLDDGHTIELISIGLIDDIGNEYYAVNADCDFNRIAKDDWLWANVVRSLPTSKHDWTDPNHARGITTLDRTAACVKPRWVIANEVRDFILIGNEGDRISLWADYAAYDHVVLAQLWGPMVKLPDGIPMWTHDIQQLIERLPNFKKPAQDSGEHNALEDARHNRRVYQSAMAAADA